MFVSDDWLIERAGVHRSTVARWRLTGRYPPAVRRLAELEQHGDLSHLCCHWTGWRIDGRAGALVSPEGERYTPGQIRALALRAQQLRALQQAPSLIAWLKPRIRLALLLMGA